MKAPRRLLAGKRRALPHIFPLTCSSLGGYLGWVLGWLRDPGPRDLGFLGWVTVSFGGGGEIRRRKIDKARRRGCCHISNIWLSVSKTLLEIFGIWVSVYSIWLSVYSNRPSERSGASKGWIAAKERARRRKKCEKMGKRYGNSWRWVFLSFFL